MPDMQFDRKSDQENLSKIPVLETLLMGLKEDVSEIKMEVRLYNGVKTDVGWLKKFFWIVATGTMTALAIAIMGVILKQ